MKKLFYFAFLCGAFVLAGCNREDSNKPDLKKTHAFSISKNKKVLFSKGNLQYHPLNNEWRFAESQLDRMNEVKEEDLSATYNGWIDLFAWGTGDCPTKVGSDTAFVKFVDWGTNKIGNDKPNTWRTLTNEEWEYLFSGRNNADSLCAIAQIAGMNGLVLLPDNWICPNDVVLKLGFYGGMSEKNYAKHQTLTLEDWTILEKSGAIFLPVNEDDPFGYYKNNVGIYWSSVLDEITNSFAYYASIDPSGAYCSLFDKKSKRFFVRLVKDL